MKEDPHADLPRQITRGAALASRLCGKERSDEAHRRDALERWRQARADGLTARAAANAVGVPRSTLWQRLADRNRLNPRSRRPHTLRRPAWSAALVAAVQETRADYPMWGKIAVLLRHHGHAVSESTTGRILKALMERGAVTPVPTCNGPRAARRLRPYARRLPKGRKPTTPGEILQLDTLTLSSHPDRPTIKQFTAHDPVGPAHRPGDAQPHTTPGASSTSSRPTCPSPPSRSTEAPGSRPTSMPAPPHRPLPAPIAPAQRTRRAQQRRLAIRGLMGPARRQPRSRQPLDRRLRRRDLQTAPGPWRTYPCRVPHTAEDPLRLICR